MQDVLTYIKVFLVNQQTLHLTASFVFNKYIEGEMHIMIPRFLGQVDHCYESSTCLFKYNCNNHSFEDFGRLLS